MLLKSQKEGAFPPNSHPLKKRLLDWAAALFTERVFSTQKDFTVPIKTAFSSYPQTCCRTPKKRKLIFLPRGCWLCSLAAPWPSSRDKLCSFTPVTPREGGVGAPPPQVISPTFNKQKHAHPDTKQEMVSYPSLRGHRLSLRWNPYVLLIKKGERKR